MFGWFCFPGEDPDSYARKNNSNAFAGFILANETDFISFKTNLLKKDAEKDPLKKATLITEIVRSISVIPESICSVGIYPRMQQIAGC